MLKYRDAALLGAVFVSLGAVSAPAEVDQFTVNGYIGAELRIFPDDAEWAGQDDDTFYPSIFGMLDINYNWDDGHQKIQLVPYGRFDFNDHRRSHADLREAYYAYQGDGWDALIGSHVVFWGRAESRHLVNVINQVDFVENFDGEEYLGQPMINANFTGEWGRVSLFAMTGFRERTFPENEARLRGPTPIAAYDAVFECSAEQWCVDFAARYENTIGALDFGVSYFHGTNREPNFGVIPPTPELVPFYEIMDQVGVDAAYAIGQLVLKFEAIYRWPQNDPFFATVFGGEYTFKNAFDDGTDIGLLLEYNFDDRDASNPGTLFDNDVFGGVRVSLNNESDTYALFGALVDVENGSTYLYVESSTRFAENWRLGIEARVFTGEDQDPLEAVESDSYVQARVTRFF